MRPIPRLLAICALWLCAWAPASLRAETGAEAWLRYAPLERATAKQYVTLPAVVVVLGDSQVLRSGESELARGVRGMLGRTLREEKNWSREPAIVMGTFAALREFGIRGSLGAALREDGFALRAEKVRGVDCLIVAGTTERGVLYGVFALLSKIARGESIAALQE